MKICTSCRIQKEYKYFFETKKNSGKYKAMCCECERAYVNARNRKKALLKAEQKALEATEEDNKYAMSRERAKIILELYHGVKS